MSEHDVKQQRASDNSRLAALANSAVFTILSRAASNVIEADPAVTTTEQVITDPRWPAPWAVTP